MWKASKSEWSFSHREVLSFSKAQDSVQVYTRNVWLRTFSKMCYPFARREAQSALPKIGSGHISPCASRGGVKKRLAVRRWLMSNASCFVLLTWWGRSCCMAWWKCLFNVMQRWRSISSTRSRRQVPQVPQATLAFHLHKCVECYCHMFIMVRPDRGKDSWTVHGKALGKANASSAPSENVSFTSEANLNSWLNWDLSIPQGLHRVPCLDGCTETLVPSCCHGSAKESDTNITNISAWDLAGDQAHSGNWAGSPASRAIWVTSWFKHRIQSQIKTCNATVPWKQDF